ncbi:bcl-2-related ovarian killer protein [Asbolus verrucosus]|uniref:Bcl-2-related ovarian killer protein n=1 Tax=Asbolus verrucosus TaxID=1661398 RepID=A0A482WAM6_ASBVE|nr:bcl-2-related ovarian killer protein [Asbolus verrucosus]
MESSAGLSRNRGRQQLSRRKFSFPAALSISQDPSGSTNNKRRFSNVGDAVTRKLSTTIGWRRPPEEVVAVGRALCALYIRSRLKRASLFTRKLGLTRVRSTVSAVPGSGSSTVRDVFPGLACACAELERAHPRLYCNIARQTGVGSDTGVGGLLAAIGHQLLRCDPTWGKVVAVFSVAGGLAVDSVRLGHPEQLHDLLDGMTELLEDRLAMWVASSGGWVGDTELLTGLSNHCRPEDQDISFVEYLGIFALVLAILLTAYMIVRFFIKFSML